LGFARLNKVDLTGARLLNAKLIAADLLEANLSGADLTGANLTGADVAGANLSGVDLTGANLTGAEVTGVDLTGARLAHTLFALTNLIAVKGLDRCNHADRSIIDFWTLEGSDPLPVAFLRGVGLPDHLIESLPSLLNKAIQLYSCFISYSSN